MFLERESKEEEVESLKKRVGYQCNISLIYCIEERYSGS